ncbi:MAG TPA: PIG-L deacetylase family protein [Candidatus Tumulicola sp.]|jgi:LmbE family N-acetylglucosaminyl deacetylase
MRSALVIGAHPDDAELMVGGIIALLADQGVRVTVALFTTAAEVPSAAPRRKQAAHEAAAILGHDLLWIEEGRYDHVVDMPEPRCVGSIDRLLRERRPDLVLSHGTFDSHCDHAQLGRCVIAATRQSGAQFFAFGPSEYRAQPVHSFVPNTFVDVSAYMDRKRAAIECYNYDGAPYHELRADEVAMLNRADGIRCGAEFAETLQVVRQFGIPRAPIGMPGASLTTADSA